MICVRGVVGGLGDEIGLCVVVVLVVLVGLRVVVVVFDLRVGVLDGSNRTFSRRN